MPNLIESPCLIECTGRKPAAQKGSCGLCTKVAKLCTGSNLKVNSNNCRVTRERNIMRRRINFDEN